MKSIILKQNGTGKYEDGTPYLLTDGKLEIKTELPSYNGEFFFIAENNGKEFKKTIQQNGFVALEGLTAGELKSEVKHYIKGTLVKSYKVEPLLLREVDGSLSATPEFADLKAEIAVLKEALKQEMQAVERLTESLTKWKQTQANVIKALIRFAFDDYSKNVYLNGGDFEQFCREYGFELTDEDIKNLNGGEVNDKI